MLDEYDEQAVAEVTELIEEQLQEWVDELVEQLLYIGALVVDEYGNLIENVYFQGSLARISISTSGIRFSRDWVNSVVGGASSQIGTGSLKAILVSIPIMVAAVVGWIPVFGWMLTAAVSTYIYANMGIIVGGFIEASLRQRGVEFFFSWGWHWFVPWVGIFHRIV